MELVHSQTDVPVSNKALYLICVFRDERPLLEYFISYYRALGVTHFLMVDNGSEDGGGDYLRTLSGLNLELFRTNESYRRANYGMLWVNELLELRCRNHYCLVIDADELFAFPPAAYKSIWELIADMEGSGANVFPTNLVDMYPQHTDSPYQPGSSYLSQSPYYDQLNRQFYRPRHSIYGGFSHKTGGARLRILDTAVCAHNFPFFKFNFQPLRLSAGRHYFNDGVKDLHESPYVKLHNKVGVLLHFKFLKANFGDFVEKRIRRNQDWNDSAEYRAYRDALKISGTIDFMSQKFTRKLETLDDLEDFFNDY